MAIIKVFGSVFDENSRILLVHRLDGDQIWTTPGGKLDAGESPETGLVRLTKLETGLDVEPTRLVGIYSATFKDHIFIFLETTCKNLDSLDSWLPNEYLSEVGFFSEEELPSPMYQRTRIRIHDAFIRVYGTMRELQNV